MSHFVVMILYYHLLAEVVSKIDQQTVEDGGCLIWLGAIDQGSPVLAIPYRRLGRGSSLPTPPVQLRVRTLMLELFTKKRPSKHAKTPRSIIVSTTCRNPACICPDCATYMNRGQAIAHGLAHMDKAKALLRAQRISVARKDRRVLTDDQVERIRNETETPARVLAREMGKNFSVVRNCRLGTTYRNYSATPFSGLGI